MELGNGIEYNLETINSTLLDLNHKPFLSLMGFNLNNRRCNLW